MYYTGQMTTLHSTMTSKFDELEDYALFRLSLSDNYKAWRIRETVANLCLNFGYVWWSADVYLERIELTQDARKYPTRRWVDMLCSSMLLVCSSIMLSNGFSLRVVLHLHCRQPM